MNQEVVELFVAPSQGSKLITRYHEVESSPHNALYVAKIHNPYGNGTDKSNTMVPCSDSGIQHHTVLHRDAELWEASLLVPWSLIGGNGSPSADQVYRINLFRVLKLDASDTSCNDSICRYGAWSPTGVFPSNYHVTIALGVMALEA